MECKECGHENPEQSKFCERCGTLMEGVGGSDTTIQFIPEVEAEKKEKETEIPPFDELKEDRPVLVVTKGPNKGAKYVLEKEEVTVGRHPESDIFLSDITVSRNHARIMQRGGGFAITDAGSLNGTYLNRKRIDESALGDHDELQIGKFKLVFLAGRGKA